MKTLSYQDILLIANYSELETREQADTSVDLCGWKFKLPVVPANMQDVVNVDIARYLSRNGYFYILHRFDGITVPFVESANQDNLQLISISTGVNDDSLKELQYIAAKRLRVDFITIDVAHGHHKKVKERISLLKDIFPKTIIIAGNIMSRQAYKDLVSWGADVIKIGVGQGSICTTRFQTGFSMPMFSCIKETKEFFDENGEYYPNGLAPIIADGGVQNIGDISKAIVAGATMVMTGKLFAPCIDSPARIIDGHKQYRGSTSFAAKKHNKHIEGKVLDLEADITFAERLQEIKEALQSSISYSGGKDLKAFSKVKWIEGK